MNTAAAADATTAAAADVNTAAAAVAAAVTAAAVAAAAADATTAAAAVAAAVTAADTNLIFPVFFAKHEPTTPTRSDARRGRRHETDPHAMNHSTVDSSSRTELLAHIETVLDREIRPGLLADGGNVEVVGIDADNIVQVRLKGACQGCPSSVTTLTFGIEAALKAQVPEIRFLEAVP